MSEYHKIQTVYHRDADTNFKTLIEGRWSHPEFEYLQHNQWTFTEKVDGTNIRLHYDNTKNVQLLGRNDHSQIPTQLNDHLIELVNNIQPQINELDPFQSFTIYGEGYGKGIQKVGKHYCDDNKFVVFDININGIFLNRQHVERICNSLKLDIVPIIGYGTLHDAINLVKQGFNSKWGNFTSEGIVARPSTELLTHNAQRIITKIKHKDFIK